MTGKGAEMPHTGERLSVRGPAGVDLAERFGLPGQGAAHSGLSDARSLAAAAFVHFERGLISAK